MGAGELWGRDGQYRHGGEGGCGEHWTVIGLKDSIDIEENGVVKDIGVDGTVIGIIIDITDMMNGGVGDAILGHIIGHGVDIMGIRGIMDMTDIDVKS
jgi:hypothetical protein